jgi:hypothetical protein
MNVFKIPRSLIVAFKCTWIGWYRKGVTDHCGRPAEELKIVCNNPTLNTKEGTILYTCSDMCRICEFWKMEKKNEERKDA